MHKVKEFWESQAELHKTDSRATNPDRHYREVEINAILERLPLTGRILDVGCGNGYSTARFARRRPQCQFIGMDYSEKMIQEAVIEAPPNCQFTVGDALKDLGTFKVDFDCIVSERCLINLASWEEQKQAILNMKAALKDGGMLILVENTTTGLHHLNRMRARYDLPPIAVRWHNRYLPGGETNAFLLDHFRMDAGSVTNIGATYYLISRVVYAALSAREGKEPDYDHPLNEIAAKLPRIPGLDCSPNMMYVCRK